MVNMRWRETHRRRGLAWTSWPADGLAALVVTRCTVQQSL